MKSKLLSLLLLSSSLVFPGVAGAQVLFDEDFEDSLYEYYSAEAGLNNVAGWGVLQHGRWSAYGGEDTLVSTSTAQSFSSSHSMRMTGGGSQFVASFGLDGSGPTATHDELVINFAFYLTNANSVMEFLIRDESGNDVVYVGLGVYAGIRVPFAGGGDTQYIGTDILEADTWYNLKLTLSANPGNGQDQYSVSLYEADGVTQIRSTVTGGFYNTSDGSGYSYMTGIFNPVDPGDLLYIDNISAQAIPEGNEVIYLMIGAVCVGAFYRRRLLKASA